MEDIEKKDKRTILVVDDEKPIVEILVYNLQKEGYDTLEAYDGETAIQLALEKKPDLILLDIMLPRVDGLTVCKRIRHTLNVPIIMLSAKDEEIDKILGLELGADDYITKPFSSGYLRARISSLLKQREMLHDYFMKQAFRSFEQEDLVASSVSLDSFSPSIPQITSFDEVFIQRVIQVVESKLQEQDFKIEDLADTMKMGRTVFYRKVKSILGVTPIDLVKDMRVKRAIQLLDSGNYNISQVAYMSGFSSPQYFSRVFKELKNCTPSEYKTKAFD